MSRRLRRIHGLAHQFRAFQQKRHIGARDLDNETLTWMVTNYQRLALSERN